MKQILKVMSDEITLTNFNDKARIIYKLENKLLKSELVK